MFGKNKKIGISTIQAFINQSETFLKIIIDTQPYQLKPNPRRKSLRDFLMLWFIPGMRTPCMPAIMDRMPLLTCCVETLTWPSIVAVLKAPE